MAAHRRDFSGAACARLALAGRVVGLASTRAAARRNVLSGSAQSLPALRTVDYLHSGAC